MATAAFPKKTVEHGYSIATAECAAASFNRPWGPREVSRVTKKPGSRIALRDFR